MKTLILLLTVFLIGCSMPQINNQWYELNSIPAQLKNETNPIKIFNWVVNNMDYRSYANGFVPAQETLNRETANCANLTLLILALNYNIRHTKGDLILCLQKNNSTGETGIHYTPRIDGIIIEQGILQIYRVIKWDDIPNYIFENQGN